MIKRTLPYLFLLLTYCACKKPSFSYSILGIVDALVAQQDTTILPLFIQQSSGTSDSVYLSVTGLPDGVTALFDHANTYPGNNVKLSFIASNLAVLGSTVVKLSGTTKSGNTNSYNIKLTVTPGTSCVNIIIGKYASSVACAVSPDTHDTSIITEVSGVLNRVNISNFGSCNCTVYGDFNCHDSSLTIPQQVVNGNTIIEGNNYPWAFRYISIIVGNYYKFHGVSSDSCSVWMTKK